MKKTLQEIFPEHKLMTVAECFAELGWTSEYPEDDERGTGPITCDCGEAVICGGWIGTEYAHCPGCHKGMQDVTGILPHPAMANGAGVAQHIDYDNVILPEDGREWIPVNVWGR